MPTPAPRFPLAAALALTAGLACGKDPGAPVPVVGIVVVQGDAQTEQVGRALPTLIVLHVLDPTGAGASAFTRTVSNTSMLIHSDCGESGMASIIHNCITILITVLLRSVPLPVRTTLLLGLLLCGGREVPLVPQRTTAVCTDDAAHREDLVAATRASNPECRR